MKIKTKHTPGPWRASVPFIGTDETDPQTIAYLSDHRNRKPRLTVEQAANGALIAAVPDLLVACELARYALDPGAALLERGWAGQNDAPEALAAINSAIAKARQS